VSAPMKDYYELLGIPHGATLEDINKAFRKLSLQWHPDNNPTKRDDAYAMFSASCAAYEVLSNTKWRSIFEHYGEDGLKNGLGGGYKFSGNPTAVFMKFFGVDNPWALRSVVPHQFFSKEGQRDKNPPKCPPLWVHLPCTLEELFTGVTKVLDLVPEHSDDKGAFVRKVQATLRVSIPMGTASNTIVVYPKNGHLRDGHIQGDVHVMVTEEPHDRFTRDGNDLHLTVPISLTDALTGFPVNLQTLDDRNVRLFINEVVHPQYVKRVEGFGFTIPAADGKDKEPQPRFGDLLLTFTVTFPAYLDNTRQTKIKEALEGSY